MRRIDSDERQRPTAVTPSRPVFSYMMGSDGAAPTALLPLVNDTTASPSSRRIAFVTAALRMRPTRLPPRAVSAHDALGKAEAFLEGMYKREDLTGLRLEALELVDDGNLWLVTISFLPKVYEDEIPESGGLLPAYRNPRLYKTMHIRTTDGYVEALLPADSS